MPYIDNNYYVIEYEGTPVDVGSFYRLVKRATETIDILTKYKLTGVDIESLPPFIKKQIKKATAAQVEYLITNGESISMGGGSFSQVSAGNFTYGDKAGISRAENMTNQLVLSLLSSTGLLYTGVDSYD